MLEIPTQSAPPTAAGARQVDMPAVKIERKQGDVRTHAQMSVAQPLVTALPHELMATCFAQQVGRLYRLCAMPAVRTLYMHPQVLH
jgi:hypothetical protein